MKYVKKPVVIDAMQYVGQADLTELKNWVETFGVEFRTFFNADAKTDGISVNTLEGTMNVNVGDYIIRGVKGEFYPCKPDIFAMTYDVVLGENLPEIYNQFPKPNPENVTLADRIAGKIDVYGNPIVESEADPNTPIEQPVLNDFLSRRIAGEVDELGNPIINETDEPTKEEIDAPKKEETDVKMETFVVEKSSPVAQNNTTKTTSKNSKKKKKK